MTTNTPTTDQRFPGVAWMDVLALYPADGWVAVYASTDEDRGFFVSPLLFWALVVDKDGCRRIDAFDEPTPADEGCAFHVGVLDTDNFVCFAKAADVETDAERFAKLARDGG